MKKLISLVLLVAVLLAGLYVFRAVFGGADVPDSGQDISQNTNNQVDADDVDLPDENGSYTTKEDVALYLWVYGELPDNFITKKEAQNLGWSGGALEPYAPGCCIGGDRFGNYEGILPETKGVTYTECDIDTMVKNAVPSALSFPAMVTFTTQRIIMRALPTSGLPMNTR